jgi:hypothetical protein
MARTMGLVASLNRSRSASLICIPTPPTLKCN